MPRATRDEVWLHFLGAKAGGGLTYLRDGLPELAASARRHGLRLVVLLPSSPTEPLPPGVRARVFAWWSSSSLHRLVFDQLVLPLLVLYRRPMGVCFTGNFSSIVLPTRSVVLLRNTIYLDRDLLDRLPVDRRVLNMVQRWLVLAGASRAHRVIYPSFFMRSLAEMRAPWLRTVGVVAPFGFRSELLRRRNERRDGASDHLTVLVIASYTPQKNLPTVFRALAQAKALGLEVTLRLTTTLSEAPTSPDRQIIEENRLVESGYLEFVGALGREELMEELVRADTCLMPSITESFGHPMIEAMAAGTPLICADRPYAREACGVHACWYDPDDPQSLVDLWASWNRSGRPPPPPGHWLTRRFSWADHADVVMDAMLDSPLRGSE